MPFSFLMLRFGNHLIGYRPNIGQSFGLIFDIYIYSMGNECRTSKKANDYLEHQLQIYKWRADVRYNTHIARTYLTKSQQNQQRVLTKMISDQLSNTSDVNLQQLIREYRQEEGQERLEEFLGF